MGIRQSVLMLVLAEDECVILVCQKVRLGFLNVPSVRTLVAFSITESISALCLSLTDWSKGEFWVFSKFFLYYMGKKYFSDLNVSGYSNKTYLPL